MCRRCRRAISGRSTTLRDSLSGSLACRLLQDLFPLAEPEAVVAEEERAALGVEGDHLVRAREGVAGLQLLVHRVVDPDVDHLVATVVEDVEHGHPLRGPGLVARR